MKKKLLALVLSLCFVLAMVPATAFAATDAEEMAIIEAQMDISWYSDGADEYHIDSAAQLWGLCYLGRWQNYVSFEGKTIFLDADIDLQGAPAWISLYTSLTNYAFKGTFDGQGHVINNLTGQPLFGSIINATVKNVIVANANVTGTGIIASQTAVTGVIDNCVAIGKTATTSSLGGITNLNAGTINNCIAMVTVTAGTSNVGGIANNNTGTISNSFAFNDAVTNTRELSPRGRVAAMGTGKFINNFAYDGMSSGLYSFGDITDDNDRNGISITLDEIYAAGILNGINSELIPEYLRKTEEPVELLNRFGVFLDETSVDGIFTTEVGFNLGADFPANQVNLVEITLTYNAEYFTAETEILVDNAIVRSVKNDDFWGFVTIVIGAPNEGEIAYEDYANIGRLILTPKEDVKPDYATINLSKIEAYSMGELVYVEVVKDYDYFALVYRELFDVNGDGSVDLADLSLALYYYGATEADDSWGEARYADFSKDGVVDMIDITMLVNYLFGE